MALCDRGTLDGLAYWPGLPESYWSDLGTTLDDELRRYAAVIHLRVPSGEQGYNHQNPLRIESALEAAEIDTRIAAAWSAHPKRFFIESTGDFLDKIARAVSLIRAEVPECCRRHVIPEIADRT